MIRLKPGASVRGLGPEMVLAAGIVAGAFRACAGRTECTVTSGTDGDHGDASRHYSGDALDFRTHHLPRPQLDELVPMLREALGRDFDVVLEDRDQPNEHLHVEFDPKRPDRAFARARGKRVPH